MQLIDCELPAQWKQTWGDQREPVLILQAFGETLRHFHVPLPRLGRNKRWQSAVLLLKSLHLRSIERNLCRINTDRKRMQRVIPALISKVSINAWYVCCFKVEFLCTQDFRNEYAYSAAITACEKSTLPTVVSTGRWCRWSSQKSSSSGEVRNGTLLWPYWKNYHNTGTCHEAAKWACGIGRNRSVVLGHRFDSKSEPWYKDQLQFLDQCLCKIQRMATSHQTFCPSYMSWRLGDEPGCIAAGACHAWNEAIRPA